MKDTLFNLAAILLCAALPFGTGAFIFNLEGFWQGLMWGGFLTSSFAGLGCLIAAVLQEDFRSF